MNENHSQIEGSIPELEQNEQIRSEGARCYTGSFSDISDVSTQLSGGGARRLWMKKRSKAWWDQCNHPDFPEEDFRWAFKMSKATFDLICSELDPVVTKEDTMLPLAIPFRQRVAVCIWRLATGEPLRLVSKRFGLGISTGHLLVLEVCSAMRSVLMNKYVQWPDEEKMKEIKNEFESVSGIQNVGGSMYQYTTPGNQRRDANPYSTTVHGVVDSKGIFTDFCFRYLYPVPDDDTILEMSALWQRARRGHLKDVLFVGNSGHPLLDWVLVPYALPNLCAERLFNEKMGEIQRVAEEAFSRLKGRWSCLQKISEVGLFDLPDVLYACCILHNICEMRNDVMDRTEMMNFSLIDDEVVPKNYVRFATIRAIRARDQIAHHLWDRNHATTGLH